MKISIDLDGVLWHNQAFFRSFMLAMQKEGHQVGILTSHKIIHEFADRALMEKRDFPCPDFYIGRPKDHKERTDGLSYAALKVKAIQEHGIDYHFDDSITECIRESLGPDAYKIISIAHRGEEENHFE